MARAFDVAVMHDFFVDRLVHTQSLQSATKDILRKGAAGGGGIHGVRQEEIRGGNAVNLAHALARLGLRTLLISHSDLAHRPLLEAPFEGLKAEVRIKPLAAGLTVAFEEKVNVMLGDGKGAADFGPQLLDESDWTALEASRVVCSVNWAANRRGTQLLIALRKHLGKEKPIYLDPADFRDNVAGFASVLRMIADERVVDWLSMNEQEAGAAAAALGIAAKGTAGICLGVARRLGVVFDLHGTRVSRTSEGTRVASAPISRVRPKRFTGAGDVWDAGAICGRLRGMGEEQRLRFANAAAKLYLENDEPLPPTLEQVLQATE